MPQPEDTPRTTTTSIDDGSDDRVTGDTAGTVRDELDHEGNPRTSAIPSDAGATAAAAHEVHADNEDEPTRSE